MTRKRRGKQRSEKMNRTTWWSYHFCIQSTILVKKENLRCRNNRHKFKFSRASKKLYSCNHSGQFWFPPRMLQLPLLLSANNFTMVVNACTKFSNCCRPIVLWLLPLLMFVVSPCVVLVHTMLMSISIIEGALFVGAHALRILLV